eukprot:gb/GECH01009252.1/.p1 GENE.gb/GECH01009252.1/~~gb/GECH01009252.1/.p1  ORF type:complete len:102 (+),score=19.81 gb/GECH01009252.1/:1-306(+)
MTILNWIMKFDRLLIVLYLMVIVTEEGAMTISSSEDEKDNSSNKSNMEIHDEFRKKKRSRNEIYEKGETIDIEKVNIGENSHGNDTNILMEDRVNKRPRLS